MPNQKIKFVHESTTSLAGAFQPHEIKMQPNSVLVIMPHEGHAETGIGCGALGHLNPHHAEITIKELFLGLEKHGINPQAFFGADQQAIVKQVLEANLEQKAQDRAHNLFSQAIGKNVAVVAAVHAHADGVISSIMHDSINKLDPSQPITLVISHCSDARSSPKIAEKIVARILRNHKVSKFKLGKGLVAQNPATQQPTVLLFHAPSVMPKNKRGAVFKVSANEWGILQKLSAAYAIMSFGPNSPLGHSPKSLVRIKFNGTGKAVKKQICGALKGISGIKLG